MSNDILEPIEDEKSKIIANEIGLPKRKLDNSSDMGTTLLIVDPTWVNDLPRNILEYLKKPYFGFFGPR